MDNEANDITEHGNGDECRQHGQPSAIALARIHRRIVPSRPELSKRALLAPVEVGSSNWKGDSLANCRRLSVGTVQTCSRMYGDNRRARERERRERSEKAEL
jgi:hypothetical protein